MLTHLVTLGSSMVEATLWLILNDPSKQKLIPWKNAITHNAVDYLLSFGACGKWKC